MKNDLVKRNACIGVDVAADERRAFLAKLSKQKRPTKPKDLEIAPGVMASSVFGQDVSGADRRSIKAQLAGRGDYRAAWWNLNNFMHRLFKPQASQESVMYDFHSRQHEMTFGCIEAKQDFNELRDAFRAGGLLAGLKVFKDQNIRSFKENMKVFREG